MLSEHERRKVREFLDRLRLDGVDSILHRGNPQMWGDFLTDFSSLSALLMRCIYGGDQELNPDDMKLFYEAQAKINNRFIGLLHETFYDDVNDLVLVSKTDARKCAELIGGLNGILCGSNNDELTSMAHNLRGSL